MSATVDTTGTSRLKVLLVVAVTLPIALGTHALAGLWTFLGTCSVSDTATTVPAPASMQGRVCDRQDHWLNLAPWGLLVLGVVVAVVLAVRLLPSRWPGAGLTACLWVPLVVTAVLAAPPDDCTAGQRETEPAYACSRAGNG